MHDKHVAPEPVFVKPKHVFFTMPSTEPDVYRVPKALGAISSEYAAYAA
jgi:hypothetical protein